MKSDSCDIILDAMVGHSDNNLAMGVVPAYKDACRGTTEAARFSDRVEVVASLGNVGSSLTQVVVCQTCGCAASRILELHECQLCSMTSCVRCNPQPGTGCRGCNGGPTSKSQVPSEHLIGLCGDDRCCGTGEYGIAASLLLQRMLWLWALSGSRLATCNTVAHGSFRQGQPSWQEKRGSYFEMSK